MAPQHDFILDNQIGAQFRADLNLALEAIATVSSGAVEPTTTYAYQYWADTTTNYLKQRDASNAGWIVRGKLTEDYGQAGQVLTSAGSGLPAVWANITDDNAWTVAQDATNAHFTFTGNGFDGTEANPDIYLVRGGVYNFTNASTTKGFQIQSTAGLSGTAYSDGITNNPALAPDASTTETLVWTVQMDAPSELYYHSTVDAGPGGNIYILDEAGGGALEWTLTANGTSDYIFAGPGFAGTETDPDLYVVRGQTYKFTNSMGAHPFQIQSTQGTSGTAYNDGITNNAVSNGTLTWEVRMDAPSTLYYQCTSHALMAGVIHVLDEGSAVASIDDLSDVDTSTVAPTDGQALVWDNTAQKWEPGTVSGGGGTTLPSAQDGEALIYENGQWVAGPVIGGVDYSGNQVSTYTAPSGFNYWNDTFTFNSGVTNITLSNNDLTAESTSTQATPAYSTSAKSTGKWYWEISLTGVNTDTMLGITVGTSSFPGASGTGGLGLYHDGPWFNDSGATVVNTSPLSESDVVMFALDANAKKLWVGLNGTWENSGDPAAGTGAVASAWTATPDWLFAVRTYQSGMVYTIENSGGAQITIPYSIDKLDDVDTSTVAPTDGQALVWDNTAQKWEPGTVSGGGGASLPSANDGEALIYENGQWVAGPVIGGVNYTPSGGAGNYTAPTGFSVWVDTFTLNTGVTSVTLSNNDLTASSNGNNNETTAYSSTSKSTGKWYWEISISGVDTDTMLGITVGTSGFPGSSGTGGLGLYHNGSWFNNSGATVTSTSAISNNDVVMFALDADAKKLWVGFNGTWENSGDPAAGTGEVASAWTATPDWLFSVRTYNSGIAYTIETVSSPVSIPYSIDKLDDVDTSTVAPTDGQALVWDNTAQKWEPGSIAGGVSSVNTLTGAVSLGIEDLDDFALNTGAGTITHTNRAPGSVTNAGDWDAFNSGSGAIFQWASTGSLHTEMLNLQVGDSVTFNFGSGDEVHTISAAPAVNNSNSYFLRVTATAWTSTMPAQGASCTVTSTRFSPTQVSLADGDILQYVSADSKFKPAQAAGVRSLLGIDEYADDTAAGTGGLSSGELYYNTTSSSYVLKS